MERGCVRRTSRSRTEDAGVQKALDVDMSSTGKRKREQRLLRLRNSLTGQGKRLDGLEAELAATVAAKTTIYLDTSHWVNLRHVVLARPTAKPEYAEILSLFESLGSRGKVCCPVGSWMFEELMKQCDPATRQTTAKLMDRLAEAETRKGKPDSRNS